jgi:3-oxoacyl-(acyl-carrier-protein) synthase
MRDALDDASVAPERVEVVCLAAGDDASEAAELAALRKVFGGRIDSMRLVRPKRLAGEPLGAGEGLALFATVAVLEGSGSLALVNAFEMGGSASSLVVRVP